MSRGRDEEPRPYKAGAPQPAAPSTDPSSRRDPGPAASTSQIDCPSLVQPLQAERGGDAARRASELHGNTSGTGSSRTGAPRSKAALGRLAEERVFFLETGLELDDCKVLSNPNHSVIL